mgnify:CR=1 FL=1
MKFLKKNLYKSLLSFTLLITPFSLLYAACDPAGGKLCNPLGDTGATNIPEFIRTLLIGALQVGIPLIALAVIYCGYLFVAARGNSEKLGKAKDALLYTLIGAAILLGSWAIAELISTTVAGLKT